MWLSFHMRQCSLHKAEEQGMGPVRAALEFGMELAAHKPEVTRQLHHLHQVAVWGQTGQKHALLREDLAEFVVEFVAVAVPFGGRPRDGQIQ